MHCLHAISFTCVCLRFAFICWKGPNTMKCCPFQQIKANHKQTQVKLTASKQCIRRSAFGVRRSALGVLPLLEHQEHLPNTVLFRYAPHCGIITHTSYLPTGQRSRLKKVIQMQINSNINPRRRRDNQFFLSCFTRSASSFIFIYFTFLGFLLSLFQGVFLVRLLTFFPFVTLLFLLASVAYLALDS